MQCLQSFSIEEDSFFIVSRKLLIRRNRSTALPKTVIRWHARTHVRILPRQNTIRACPLERFGIRAWNKAGYLACFPRIPGH